MRKGVVRKKVVTPKFASDAKIPFVGEQGGLTKAQVISELTKSPHGDLSEYLKVGVQAVKEDPEFFAHLIAWNHAKGQIRDAKVALPVVAIRNGGDAELVENALAHVADLRPREFSRALQFARQIGCNQRQMKRLVERYLRDLEADFGDWERTALLHRDTITTLYGKYRVQPNEVADFNLFGPLSSKKYGKRVKPGRLTPRFAAVASLRMLSPEQIAGQIRSLKLPFMVVKAALGGKIKDPDVLAAVIQGMSAPELVTNMKSLERWGVKTVPALRAALEQALGKAAQSKTAKGTLKTSQAIEALAGDEVLSGKLKTLQEAQLTKLQTIEGNWLVMADISSSMSEAIEPARQVSAILARSVKGKVYLVFFNTSPRFYDVTGMTFEQITTLTRNVSASGSTAIGCPLVYLKEKGLQVDGVAIVSDGEETSSPGFTMAYQDYCKKLGVEPTVYFYKIGSGEPLMRNCKVANPPVQLEVFDIGKSVDYYSLPNLVQTMRVGRYSLLDEVMATKLQILDRVLDRTKGVKVVVGREAVYA